MKGNKSARICELIGLCPVDSLAIHDNKNNFSPNIPKSNFRRRLECQRLAAEGSREHENAREHTVRSTHHC